MSCPAGKIKRKAYTTKNGVHYKATCVKDRGRPGKGPKILPAPKNTNHLSKYGYSLDESAQKRHNALKRAVDDKGLEALRRLNLIRNITATGTSNKAKLSRDVDYASKLYEKKKSRRTSRKKSKSRRRRKSKSSRRVSRKGRRSKRSRRSHKK